MNMIIKAYQPPLPAVPEPSESGASSPPTILFRGRDAYFWKRALFNGIEPINFPVDPGADRHIGFDFLLVFDPRLFPAINIRGVEEIREHLAIRDPEEDVVFSIAGEPFFVVFRGAYRSLVDAYSSGTTGEFNIFSTLKTIEGVGTLMLDHVFTILDTQTDITAIEQAVVEFQVSTLADSGVQVEDMKNFYIEGLIPIGRGSRIASGVVVTGDSRIGNNVRLYPHNFLENAVIGSGCTLLPGCVVRDSSLENNAQIGPYTHLRAGALVKDGAKMGNFVEMKKSILGKGSKAMHLTYIGDADVGENVNIGAGTITCNYDGVNKNKTIIRDGVFIGSGTELVAPVTIQKNSYVAAGSTITEEVPQDSLAVARQRQRNILQWVARKRKRKKND